MAAYQPVDAIEVRVWGRSVGAVALDPSLGYYAFEYQPAFIHAGIELAPLSMPLESAREPFVFAALPEPTFHRLPALLADALPDEFGNNLIDAWMATRGIDRAHITPLDRLAYMGQRAMGALEFKPVRGPRKSAEHTAIELKTLVESARKAARGELGPGDLAQAALAQIIKVGTSAGGARAKAVVAWNPRTGEIRAGQFDVEPGFEHWIIKFDGVGPDHELGITQHYGRIEYAYSLMARAAGITMMPCRLLEEGGRAHFMTRRFDRDHNTKHHVQTLCAMSHLDYRQRATHDVSQIFLVLERLGLDHPAREEAFRRIAFNVMASNHDDHTKNVSFLLKEGGAWELAPAYDVTYAYNPRGQWTYQHLMSVNGRFSGIGRDDLMAVADRFGVGRAATILTTVREAVGAWPGYAAEAGLAEAEVSRVTENHQPL